MVESPFQKMAGQQPAENNKTQRSPFQQMADGMGIPQESGWKSSLRTAMQIPQGIAEGTAYGIGMGLTALGALGETDLEPEEWHRLRKLYEERGEDFDEAFERGRQEMLETIPTISNIGRKVEEETGIPLEPKTRLQKGLRFFSTASKLAPKGGTIRGSNTSVPRPVLGAAVEGTKEILQDSGVPEPIAEIASFGILKMPSAEMGKIGIGKDTKPSGLTTRRYEKLEKPTEVSAKKISKINEKVENEFKNIASDIIEKSPIEETYTALKNDSAFKKAAEEGFEKVNKLADDIPDTFSTKDLKKKIVDRTLGDKGTGFLPSEYEQIHKKFIKQAIKDTPTQDISARDLIKQYRKNNKAFGELREPGQSSAYNRGKKQALMDYNKVIAEMIEEKFPDTEFSNLFKSTNKKWQEIMDAESISEFMDELFEGKINFKTGQKLLEKEGLQFPFKRALGKQGYENFEQLLTDLMSTKKANSMMKAAESKGFVNFAKTTVAYVLHPKLGYAKGLYDAGKLGYKKLWESLLDKPQLAIVWDKGMKQLKKGNFAEAEKTFDKLKAETKSVKPEVLPKENVSPTANEKFSEPIETKAEVIKKQTKSTFETEKGSSYEMNEDGTTTRNKAFRPEHGQKEQGIQPKSEKTWFISEEDANKLGEFQTKGQEKRIIQMPDGKLGIMYESGKDAGKVESRTIISPQDSPKEGLIPLESWEGGKKVHFGNKITKVNKKTKPSSTMTETKVEEVKRQDISKKGLKEQKFYLIEELNKAIASLKKTPNRPQEKLTFKVPGDGEFKIFNDLKALNQFKKEVEKRWPDKPLAKPRAKKHVEYPEHALKEYELKQNTKRDAYLKKNAKNY